MKTETLIFNKTYINAINCKADKRGAINELIITNY